MTIDTRRLERLLRARDTAQSPARRPSRQPAAPGAAVSTYDGRNARDHAAVQLAWAALIEAEPTEQVKGHGRFEALARTAGLPEAFDMLRAQVLQSARSRGWRSIGITAPDRGCGASFVTANLAASFGRLDAVRTMVLDLDLRAPSLATGFGLLAPGPISAMIAASVTPGEHLRRLGDSLALGLSTPCGADTARLFQNGDFSDTMEELAREYAPDIILCDLPPLLTSDMAVAATTQLDAVLFIADGTRSQANDLRECEALLHDKAHFLGVILNRGRDRGFRRFAQR